MSMREDFPEAGEAYLGGTSDGWEYRTVFAGTSLAHSYEMVRQFLIDEGYHDVPLPADASELAQFRVPRHQMQYRLFYESGYIHNPIKILFSEDGRDKKTLTLCIYNTLIDKHLLMFHGIVTDERPIMKSPPKQKDVPKDEAGETPVLPDYHFIEELVQAAEPLETIHFTELPKELQSAVAKLKKRK